MPIIVKCSCGKRTGVSDAMAGKTMRCSACGNENYVSGPAPGSVAQSPAAKKKNATPSVYISKEKIIGMSVIGGIVLLIVLFRLGPVSVWHQWETLQPKANGDVTDVILFSLQAYLSQHGSYNPAKQHLGPAIDGPVVFFEPYMAFTMPEKIVFRGKSNQGSFVGVYNTQTSEVEATIGYGGYVVAGLVDAKAATDSFRITGRINNGTPEAEVDGQKLQIVYPKKDAEE